MTNPARQRPFDFNGNHLAVDFTNTVNARPVFTRNDLRGPQDVLDWAEAAGFPSPARPVNPALATQAQFESILDLRENLYLVFGPIAAGSRPQPEALAHVSRRAGCAVISAEWVDGGSGFEPRWPEWSLEAIGWRLADDAMSLLRGPAVARLGACAGCGWLFVDTSRAHARRWCSMNACGVRDKMRRYHQRQATVVRHA